jgi:hypothetical protein
MHEAHRFQENLGSAEVRTVSDKHKIGKAQATIANLSKKKYFPGR